MSVIYDNNDRDVDIVEDANLLPFERELILRMNETDDKFHVFTEIVPVIESLIESDEFAPEEYRVMRGDWTTETVEADSLAADASVTAVSGTIPLGKLEAVLSDE